MIWIIIILVALIALVLWGVGAYNGLVTLRNRVKNGWAQIDVQLKQRADLIPNLVETVKGYAGHESTVLTQVTAARAGVVAAASDPNATTVQRAAAENALSRALVNLQATAEAYPQLQANQNFMDLQAQLKELESKIAYARQFYNDVVLKYNTATETVPSNIIAGLFHFEQAEYFQADEQSRQVPQVKF
ncbi:LemA family protein [Bifidobacterium sp. 82T10]|uniref:LemA family protein n=1 Tax=Bifidobacterium miconis TaxID=2834435 RepID=A0ABS6WHC4_9BIFI|nr:LemA family protein [Bifidobacterium miconis]MBW3093362.1 LemA family protein [Bifidobacterium miconis]